jgi:hypothetical protein
MMTQMLEIAAEGKTAGGNGQGKTGQGVVSTARFLPQGHQNKKEAVAHCVSTRERQIDKEAGAHDVRGSGADLDEDSDDMADAPPEWVPLGSKRRKLCLQENIVGGGSSSSSLSSKNENGKSANKHNLKATLFGVVCTECGTRVNKKGNPILPPSSSVISNHWVANKCINGFPDPEKTRLFLEEDLKKIRHNAYQDPLTVATVAAEHFQVNSVGGYELTCGNCLYHAKTKQNFNKHFGKQNNKLRCKNIPIRCKMVQSKYGIAIPEEMLKRIKKGKQIMKGDEWMLRLYTPSSDLEQLYQIIGKKSTSLGATRAVCKTEATTIFGEITPASMQSVVSSLIQNTQNVKSKSYSRHRQWFRTTNYALLHTSWCCTKLWHRGIQRETLICHRKFGKCLESRLDK